MKKAALTTVLVALTCLVTCAQAQMLVPRVASGVEDLPPLQIHSQTVTITIDNQVATTSIEQVFINNTDTALEAVYFIPLPETASVSEFAYWLAGKRIVGEVREKQEARETYDKLVGKKRDPALLEHVARNLFRANIFPVSTKEPMKIELQYQQVLPYDSGSVMYAYPLTMSGQQNNIATLTINIEIKDQKPITHVESPSHLITFERPDDNSAKASFVAADITPKRDVSLVYKVHSKDLGVSFLVHRPKDQDGYFMLMIAPQEETTEQDIVRKDVVLVFDKSGSMGGEKIEQARRALEFCIRNLDKEDRFGLITYDAVITTFRDELVPASQANVLPAIRYVKQIEADGMTNINEALLIGLKMLAGSDRQRTIIFLTDGLPTEGVTDAAQIIQNVAKANISDTRIFTFGVGDDVDDYLLLKIATGNRGAAEHVRTNESIYDKLVAFYAKISKPLLVDLNIDFGAIKTTQLYPAILPDVFKGSQLIITGRYSNGGHQTITLAGTVNRQERRFEYPAHFPEQTDDSPFVARLWAKDRVNYLLDQIVLHGETSEIKDEIVALSKEYGFITPYTSMLALPPDAKAAMNQSRYAVGGDPWVKVTAPLDTIRVTAIFPWGETKPLIYDHNEGRWTVRFIVPKGTVHGQYEVVIVITRADGSQQHLTVGYEADLQAPSGMGRAFAKHVGDELHITIWVKASDDTKRVDVLPPGGKLTGLDYDSREDRYIGKLAISAADIIGPSVSMPVYVTDAAHNRLEIELEVELE